MWLRFTTELMNKYARFELQRLLVPLSRSAGASLENRRYSGRLQQVLSTIDIGIEAEIWTTVVQQVGYLTGVGYHTECQAVTGK